MRQGLSTELAELAELAELEELGGLGGDSPRLVAPAQTTQWLPQASPITLWEHLGPHLQHLAQVLLVCW